MSISLGKREQRAITIVFTDASQLAAPVDPVNVPQTSSTDPNVALWVDPAADGLSGTLRGVNPGTCTLRTVGDADLGSGVQEVVIETEVLVTEAGVATGGTHIAGPAVPQP